MTIEILVKAAQCNVPLWLKHYGNQGLSVFLAATNSSITANSDPITVVIADFPHTSGMFYPEVVGGDYRETDIVMRVPALPDGWNLVEV